MLREKKIYEGSGWSLCSSVHTLGIVRLSRVWLLLDVNIAPGLCCMERDIHDMIHLSTKPSYICIQLCMELKKKGKMGLNGLAENGFFCIN